MIARNMIRAVHTEMLWKDIKQMRNVVAHRYGAFDFDILWETVTDDIPVLKEFCERII